MSALHVICTIGDAEYAIPADDVYQMESYTAATPVPGAPDYVLGLVQIRQQIIPVVDVRARFGLGPSAPTLGSRVVVLALGERLVGLLVDTAREVLTIDPQRFQPPPEVIAKQSAGFVKAIAQLEARMVMLLDASRIAGQESAHA
jgi:purine-binding chemotaxis protein CheW